jgi:COMPASS component SWD1
VFAFFTYWLQHYLFTDDAAGTRMKRNRKPSEKVLELQAEKVKKPSKASKSSKPKSKSLADKSNGNESGLYSDELSDE